MEWVIENQPQKFPLVKRQLESDFLQSIDNKSHAEDWNQLSDGSWVKHRRSAESHINLCRKVFSIVGIREGLEWNIQEDYKSNKKSKNLQQGSIFDVLGISEE